MAVQILVGNKNCGNSQYLNVANFGCNIICAVVKCNFTEYHRLFFHTSLRKRLLPLSVIKVFCKSYCTRHGQSCRLLKNSKKYPQNEVKNTGLMQSPTAACSCYLMAEASTSCAELRVSNGRLWRLAHAGIDANSLLRTQAYGRCLQRTPWTLPQRN